MREFFDNLLEKFKEDYLRIEENGKLSEKVFIRRIVVGVISIVLCLSAMGFSAYAYFTSSVTSGTSTLTAATYSTEIIVTKASEGSTEESAEALAPTVSGMTQVYGLEADTKYTVTIKATGNAEKGYCKIVVDATSDKYDGIYYTVPLVPSGDALTFTIQCYENVAVEFITNWGSYSGYSAISAENIIEMPTGESNFEVITIGVPTQGADTLSSIAEDETNTEGNSADTTPDNEGEPAGNDNTDTLEPQATSDTTNTEVDASDAGDKSIGDEEPVVDDAETTEDTPSSVSTTEEN